MDQNKITSAVLRREINDRLLRLHRVNEKLIGMVLQGEKIREGDECAVLRGALIDLNRASAACEAAVYKVEAANSGLCCPQTNTDAQQLYQGDRDRREN